MKKDRSAVLASPLFRGVRPEELEQILARLDARERQFDGGEIIWMAGDRAESVGVVLSGRVQVLREERWGARTLLTELGRGELFGETFACAPGPEKTLPVTVAAASPCSVLLLDYRRMVSPGAEDFAFHHRLVENMLGILAEKNLMLNRRLVHLSRRSTREKLLSYLREQSAAQGGGTFTIPFNRQELADYLCVDRSAMSAALSKLRREGVLETSRSRFRLKEEAAGGGEEI